MRVLKFGRWSAPATSASVATTDRVSDRPEQVAEQGDRQSRDPADNPERPAGKPVCQARTHHKESAVRDNPERQDQCCVNDSCVHMPS